jgi:hypothetical protein
MSPARRPRRAARAIVYLALAAVAIAAPGATTSTPPATSAESVAANKARASASIEAHRAETVDLSLQIWRFAETALKETRSS